MVGEQPQLRVLGVRVDDVTLAESIDTIAEWVSAGPGDIRVRQVATVNPEFIIAARRDPAFCDVLERTDLATADGIGVLIAARLYGKPLRGRVTGVDLVEQLAARRDPRLRLFLLGAGPGIAERAAERLRGRFSGVNIVGTWAGSPRDEDTAGTLEQIQATSPNILLVAYGAPSQELWIDRHRADLAAYGIVVAIGIGGSLDYLAGAVPRAPGLIRRLGLEWLYRLVRQPWRWRRQLALPLFMVLVLRDRLRRVT